MTDGYAAYDQFGQREGIQMLHCMAHVRRYFKEAEVNMLCWPSRPNGNTQIADRQSSRVFHEALETTYIDYY